MTTTAGSEQQVQAAPSTKKAGAHYVDNKKFYEELKKYRESVDQAILEGREKPQISNYLGDCFIKIATHLSYKANFINYTFKDDMISDGIENCLSAADKFDPSKSTNPFAYYTQIVYFAFIRRIQKEKKQQATKYRLIENLDLDDILTSEDADLNDFSNQFLDYMKKKLDQIDIDKRTMKKPKSNVLAEEDDSSIDTDN
jgi:DNA-directed RNA polymerase specialized sigma subunit